MKQDGYTLMELVVVLSVFGILAALAVPNFSTLVSRVQTRCVADEVASELRLARQVAIAHRDRIRITFDLERQTLVAQSIDGAVPPRVYHYGDKGVSIEEPSAGLDIFFYPSGRAATATTIRLHGKEGQTQTLTVGLTGRVVLR